MIQCVDLNGSILYANRTWRDTLGYSKDEITNLSIFDIAPSEYKDYWLDLLQQVISGEKLCNVDSVLRSRSGARIDIQGTVNCRFENEKPLYTRGILRDITKQKKERIETEALMNRVSEINTRLEQSKSEFEEFIHIASHDLQEPLRKVSSFGALLQESLAGKLDEDQIENLGFMIDGAKRMQSMIDDLLICSRITTRAKPFQSVDPNQVVENLHNFELAAAFEESRGELLVPNRLVDVCGDPTQVYQLFQNLIANGVKFHKDGISPSITISSYAMANNMVRFYVQDNGIGIQPGYDDKIFIMFQRLHPPTHYEGTGIGLAVCKKIVQRHGGEIGFTSKVGEGTSFWFTLPRLSKS
jgi:PAS domain S-box-containing protein